ncbi:hypothetical protein BC629DRAFT_1298285 [Irpex lacteus]|nr:hypothetical protein BC629DRAFT_1298285 [Irpex lacteus]
MPTIPTIPALSRPTSIQSRLGLSNASGLGVGGVGVRGRGDGGGRGGGNAEDREVVDELLGTMKQMLGTLGATFDTLGEQTVKVATLPAAMEAVSQISSVRKQLDDQHKRQEQRMQDMKTLLLEEVRTKLYSRLRETASEIVREVVQREIAERVRVQLQEQIPKKLREDVVSYKRQIMEVKVSLHNSEARRHNALIRANSLDEPLMPLLRPPPLPRSEWNPLTPSPLFPRDLTSLIRLGTEEARALMREYGLVREEESREESINRFLAYIGVSRIVLSFTRV